MNSFRKSAVALAGLWLAVAATAAGQDPVRIKGTTAVGRDSLVVLSVDATADTAVTWRITPSAGVTRAPKQPAGQLVFNGPPGKYQVDTLVIDWNKRTLVEASETVVIGDALKPPPDPDKPPPATGKLFFVIVRAPQATAEYLAALELPAWAELKAAGHQWKDYHANNLPAGVVVPNGTTLPAVLTLKAADGGKWVQVPGVTAFPMTNDGVGNLKGGAP